MVELAKTRTVALGDVAEFIRGITFKPSDVEKGPTDTNVDCLRTKNVQASLDTRDLWAIDPSFVKRSNQYVTEGDILISTANSWNLVGKCSWIPHLDRPTVFGGFVTVLRRRDDSVDSRYLFHWFSSDRVQRTIRSFGNQTTNISNLDLKRASTLALPLPHLHEQRRITAILDKADDLRTRRREALVQLDSLSAAYVHDLLSQEEWPRRAFGELCSRLTVGVVVKPASHYVNAGIPALRSLNVKVSGLDMAKLVHFSEASHTGPLRKSQLNPGDVVTVRTGNAGTSAVIPADAGPLNAIDLIISTPLPDLMTSEYAVAFLNSDAGRRMVLGESRGQIQQHFNVKSLQTASIPVPPIEVQQALGRRLSQVDKVRRSQLSQLDQLDALFASLQYRAFKGAL